MTKALMAITIVAAALTGRPAEAQSPVPDLILDNPSVRVTVRTFLPGAGSGRHQGIEAEVGVVTEGELMLDSPQGQTAMRPGSAYWLPGLTPHDTRNEGARPAKLYEIFLKRCD
jgi:mannose-6-phosphate isomerase-like protein (cupin superfamily)